MKGIKKYDDVFQMITYGHDMTAIYRGLYKIHPEGFPEIIIMDELPDNLKIVRYIFCNGNSALFVKEGSDEDIINLIDSEIKFKNCQIVDGSNYVSTHSLNNTNVAIRLVFASYIAEALDITLEPFTFASKESDNSEKPLRTYIDTNNLFESLYEICKGLRHDWLMSKYPDWLSEDRYPTEDIYYFYKTIAILDTNAFAIKMLEMIKPFDYKKSFPNHNHLSLYYSKLEKRIENINISLSKDNINYLRKLLNFDI